MVGVVLARPVGHLDDEAAGRADEQRQREVGGDGVRVDGQAQRAQADVQRRLPHRLVPLHRGGAPDVVDEHVQRALLGVDAIDERLDLVGHEVVDRDGDPPPAGGVDQLGRLLDRLRPVHLRALRPCGAPGAVHGGAGRAQLHGDPPPGGPGGAGDEGDPPGQRQPAHRPPTVLSYRCDGTTIVPPATSARWSKGPASRQPRRA